jgi:acyl-CoA synthetase (AMP-forming)/AMP-acid ligase II
MKRIPWTILDSGPNPGHAGTGANALNEFDATMVSVLRRRARDESRRVAVTFLRDGERDESHVSYGELDDHAMGLARHLTARFEAGERVMLVYPPGPEFLAGFFGCLYAGLVAVPVATPRPNGSMASLESIARDCSASAALVSSGLHEALRSGIDARPGLAKLAWIDSDNASCDGDGSPRAIDPRGTAYLQYTSGSTSEPRGVVIGHDNLMANLRSIVEVADGPEGGVTVGWLPLHHDMGLVSTALQSLYLGGRLVLMPPLHFLQKPIRWLRAISVHGAATSGAPNFAYELCARSVRPDLLDGLDLRSWTGAFCSAEPIRAETLDRFAQTFAATGFRCEAFYPCYGLAEATVFVTGVDRRELPVVRRYDPAALGDGRVVCLPDDEPRGRRLVGCGWPATGTRVMIVDPESRRVCPPETIGEVWVAGPGIGLGYWGRPELSAETFAARTSDGDGPFLRTGDLGFLDGGQLFVTGRLKELILIRGGNYYPQDIERTACAANPALRSDGGAAFPVDVGGEERLILVHEVERSLRSSLDLSRILGDVREAVAAELGVRIHAMVLIRPAGLPRTTSGKIRRGACRDLLLKGKLDVLAADYGIPDCRGEDS